MVGIVIDMIQSNIIIDIIYTIVFYGIQFIVFIMYYLIEYFPYLCFGYIILFFLNRRNLGF